MISLKQIALILVVVLSLGSIVGGAWSIVYATWALDARIDAKVSTALTPITEDVRDIKDDSRAIKRLLQDLMLSLAQRPL